MPSEIFMFYIVIFIKINKLGSSLDDLLKAGGSIFWILFKKLDIILDSQAGCAL